MTRITTRMKREIDKIFDAISNHDCLTHEDIMVAGGFSDIQQVAAALAWIRRPDIALQYGWTVPHVRRGRPRENQTYRYVVVGLAGEVLDAKGTRSVQEGALSTLKQIRSETRNEAHALRLCGPMSADVSFRRYAKNTATILAGVSAQTGLEVDRLEKIIATKGSA